MADESEVRYFVVGRGYSSSPFDLVTERLATQCLKPSMCLLIPSQYGVECVFHRMYLQDVFANVHL